LIRYRASWILPISGPPIRAGWVAVDRDRVAACGAVGRRPAAADGTREVDLGSVVVMPGLVNAHTHLELSYLSGRVSPGSSFMGWIRTVIAARREPPHPGAPEILDSAERGIAESIAAGTAIVGEVSNTLCTFDALARSQLAAVVFYELIGFRVPDPEAIVAGAVQRIEALPPTERVRASLAAHAPYSVAPLVLRSIRRALDRDPFAACSVHLAESAEEIEFIRSAGGPWREALEELGAWDPAWTAPGVSPVQYLDESGFLSGRVLAIHGVHMTQADLERLAARGTTLVACPRSNEYTRAGTPPIEAFYNSGVRVAVGTDSLASSPDLNVFAELATMRRIAAGVPASVLLDSATRQGARALGFDGEYGSIEPGKRARLLAVDVPSAIEDVEEYLVSGIHPEQVRWIE
jgi:cytosine/adenosine deaminase-related metal-dependent hydrolase